MLPVVTLPDAELVVLEYLRPRLTAMPAWAGVKLGTVVPAHRPFVQLRRIGGSSDLPGIDAPRIDVVAYHSTDHDRMRLALDALALLTAAASDRTSSGVLNYTGTLLGPRQMPDPADDMQRIALFTVDLLVRP